jgi:NADPH2:quinone reductase
MRAAAFSHRGPAHEVLAVRDLPDPVPGPGEVRVRIAVSGVNPTDWKTRGTGDPLPYPWQVPHHDGAGVIDAVGEGVSAHRVGERVWTYLAAYERPWGTAADFSIVPSTYAVPLPEHISFSQGAGLGVPFITAHRCLALDGPLEGRTVLVAGGAGAVGHASIQLARRAGARVITTVSSAEKAEIARTAGPDIIVNYRDSDAVEQIRAAAPDGVDRIIEVALATNLDLDLAVLRRHGSIITYAGEPTRQPILPVRQLMVGNVTLRFMLLYFVPEEPIHDAVREITAALQADDLVGLPEVHFSLDPPADAHAAVEAGAVGKVLIDLDPTAGR